MLAETSMALAAVAVEAGFYDQSHFARVFKRLIGMTPGVWQGMVKSTWRHG